MRYVPLKFEKKPRKLNLFKSKLTTHPKKRLSVNILRAKYISQSTSTSWILAYSSFIYSLSILLKFFSVQLVTHYLQVGILLFIYLLQISAAPRTNFPKRKNIKGNLKVLEIFSWGTWVNDVCRLIRICNKL